MNNEQYRKWLSYLLTAGVSKTSRELSHLECPKIPAIIQIPPDTPLLPTIKARGLNYAFSVIERLSYLSGVGHYPLALTHYMSNYRQFTENEFIDRGAYGPRMSVQWKRIYESLSFDRDTRQAVVNVYNHLQDNRGDSNGVPCTLNLQFLRDGAGALAMVVHMRSNDIMWGTPYDIAAFRFLHQVVAYWIGADVGEYTHIATSLHLYEDMVDLAKATVADREVITPQEQPLVKPPKWDLSYERTWTELELFWRAEERIRTNGATPEMCNEYQVLTSTYLAHCLRGLHRHLYGH